MGDFVNTMRNAFVDAYNPQFRAEERQNQQMKDFANQYAQFIARPEIQAIRNKPEFFQQYADMANASGNPYAMMEVANPFMKDQQNFAFNPQANPMLTADLKEYAMITGDTNIENKQAAASWLSQANASRAPSFSMNMPGQESPVMPKDTWDLFTYEDGSPLIRPPTQAEVAAGRTVDGRGLQMKSNVDATQAKAGMAAITMSQYELENSMKKYGYNPEESNPDNRLSYAATWGLDKLASLDPGAANYFGKRGQEAAERQSAFRYWSELPLRILTGAVINDDEKEGIRMQYLPVQGESAEQAKKKEARRVIFQNAMLEQSRGNNPAGIMLIGNKITDLGKMQIPEIGQVNVKMTPDGNMLITAADGDSKIVKPEQLSKLLLPSTPTSIRKR